MDFSTELLRCPLCSTDPPKDEPLLFCDKCDVIFCDNCFKNLEQSTKKPAEPAPTEELDESGDTSNNSSKCSSTGIFGTRELAQELKAFKESAQNGGGAGDVSCNTTGNFSEIFTGDTTGDDSSLGILNGGILEDNTTADDSSNFGSTLNGSANTSGIKSPLNGSANTSGITSPLNGSANTSANTSQTSPGSRILQSIQNIFSPRLSSTKSKPPQEKMAPIVEESHEENGEESSKQNGGDESCNTSSIVIEEQVEEVDGTLAVDPTCHICQGELSARSEVQCKIEGCSVMILEYEPLIRLHENQCPLRSVQCFHLKCQAPPVKTGFFQFFNFSKTKEEDNNNKQASLCDFEKHYAIHRPMMEKVDLEEYGIYEFSSLKESKCLYYKDRLLYIFEGMFAIKDEAGKIMWPQFSKACLISTAHPDIASKMKYSLDILNDNGEAIFSYNGRIFSIDDTKEIRLWNSSGGLIFPNYIFTGSDSYTCKITVSKNDLI